MPLSPSATVANVVLDHSECAEVFARNRIDFCCRGGLTLDEAAASRKVPLATLLEELDAAIARRQGRTSPDLRAASTEQLCAHLSTHLHEPILQALPMIGALARKVGRVHGGHNPKLVELSSVVDLLEDTLTAHLEVEASSVWPELTGATRSPRVASQLMEEHEALVALTTQVRALSDDFAAPDWACTSYRTLFSELEELEALVLTRLHLENNVLLPRLMS